MKKASYLKARPEHLCWWREARFGLFIHWGPVSLLGTELGWSRGAVRRDLGDRGEVPARVYDNLYKRFNPVKFDARRWVALAQAAGMKYLVFTTKHHDGFCMWDTRLSDYKITNTPFGRDVTAELASACHEAGIGLGFYYSQIDWRHPDFRTERHDRYLRYFHGQIEELATRYGKVDIFWFDGTGNRRDWQSDKVFSMIRRHQPTALINNRLWLPGDFGTPEQHVGGFQADRAWESCITLCRQWSWKPRGEMKSRKECIRTLVRCARGDGNLLLNVGPMPDGRIVPRQAARLRQIGQWLRKYGHTVYGTRGGPFRPYSTHRGDRVYVHLTFDRWRRRFVFHSIPPRIVSSRVLTGEKAAVRQLPGGGGVEFTLGPGRHDPIDTIIELRLKRPVRPGDCGG